nr:MAG TPA: hypothetical protein [Caudoviricetes sp.]
MCMVNINEREDITLQNDLGRTKVSVVVGNGYDESVELETGVWNYGAIVNALVRFKYPADAAEAIAFNSLMLMQNPSAVSEEASEKLTELDELQAWREKCKARAKELLAMGVKMGLEVTT